MTERDASAGGMTGATGDLTPDDVPEDLVTGERREIEDPADQGAVTLTQAGSPRVDESSPSAAEETSDEPRPQSEPQAGGDEVSGEDERF